MRSISKNVWAVFSFILFFIQLHAQDILDVKVIPVGDASESVVGQNVRLAKESGIAFQSVKLLESIALRESLTPYQLRKAEAFQINPQQLQGILQSAPEALRFEFDFGGKSHVLDLIRVNLLDDQFAVNTSGSGYVDYNKGLFYQGLMQGNQESLCALSFFENEIIGMISFDTHQWVMQPSVTNPGQLLLYDDRDIVTNKDINCLTDELENTFRDGDRDTHAESAPGDCIRVYIECDYALHQNKGGVTPTVNWITAVFNNVKTLYTNESINTTISEVFVWTTQDNYSTTNSITALNQFRTLRGTFNGDLAHLAALGGQNIGGVAWLDVLCTTYKYAYSNISSSYNAVPVYSWTVEVMTHEMGHNVGSNHTQWCGWSGGALDNCYTTEGGCPPGPPPSNGGTIMSYCHLTSYGINFNNGFGPQPGDKIRSRVAAVTCLGTSCGGGGGGCSAPTGLNISNITTSSATASWNTVSGASSYKFEYKRSVDANWTQVTVTTTSYNMTGLQSATTYNTRVKTVCSGTESVYSSQVNFTTSGGSGCGTPTNLNASNITTNSATISWTPVSGANSYHFQYKLTSSGTWQQVTVTPTTVNMTNLSPGTSYDVRVRAVCSSGNGSFTSVLTFTTLSSGYCTAKGNNSTYEWIARTKLNTIDRSSGSDGGYYNGTALITDLNKGTSYTLQHQAGTSGSSGTLYWKAWIDFNRDNDFLDAGEEILSLASSSTALLSKTFTVPSGAATGQARLRIAVRYGGYATSCGNFSYGEVEDYTVNLKVAGTLISGIDQGDDDAKIYPNPFNKQLFMDYLSTEDKTIDIQISDIMGRTVLKFQKQILKGNNVLEIAAENLNTGNYILKMEDGIRVRNYKIVKVD